MGKRLERLNAEQELVLQSWKEECLRVGLCTEPANRVVVEKAIKSMYRHIGKDPPYILWVDSPMTGCMALHLLKGSKGASLWASLGDSLRDSLGTCFWGQSDVWWTGFYRYPARHLGIRYAARSEMRLGWWESTTLAGWWWPYERLVIISERPDVVHMEPRNTTPDSPLRLHCADGPALRFRDGYSVWAWHGVRVPQHVVEKPHSLTANEILAEQNLEVRRAMLERMGMEHFFAQVDAQILHSDTDGAGQPRQLMAFDVPSDPDRRIVAVQVRDPSTERKYVLRVPPTMRTCTEAVAWTFNVDPSKYSPEVER